MAAPPVFSKQLIAQMEETLKAPLSQWEREKREKKLLRQVNGALAAPMPSNNRKARRARAAKKRSKR